MFNIFKYELKRRQNMIFILTGLMAGLSIGSMLMVLFGYNFDGSGKFTTLSLWHVITFIVLIGIPTVTSFTCANGHVDELLYKDTNYLMLTIPIKSWKILAGRILAGLIEYIIYCLLSFIFLVILISLQAFIFSQAEVGAGFRINLATAQNVSPNMGFLQILSTILKNIFVLNPILLLYVIFTGLSSFLLVGTVFMCVKALTRSFIRKKMIGQIIAIILFILIMSKVFELGTFLSKQWNLVQYLDLKLLGFSNGAYTVYNKPIPIYFVNSVFVLTIAAGFFALTNWLFSKKVEL